MWAAITKPFAWLMVWLYELTGNYGVAVLLFALVVNLILTPFMAKSKKSMMRQSRIQPYIQEIQNRHQGNPQKMNEEMQKLYREEGINPMSGCLWSLIPFPIMIALYSVIRQPLRRMMFVGEDIVTALQNFFVDSGWYTVPARTDAYAEIKLTGILHEHWDETVTFLQGQGLDLSRLLNVDFHFLGIDLGSVPWDEFKLIFSGAAVVSWAVIGLVLIPLVSAGLSWLSMKVANLSNPQMTDTSAATQQAQASMKSMTLMMPLMSIWFCFIMPAAMGVYWIGNSCFGMIRDFTLTRIYKRKLDIEDKDRIEARRKREAELEARRIETERLRAEGKTEKNVNTSKKKIAQNEKQRQAERSAALDKADRAARREMLGIKDPEKPASQVGNRRYARGRAYVADRYTNPEAAEEATLLAAEESEGNVSIDETMAETPVEAVTEAVVESAAEEKQE